MRLIRFDEAEAKVGDNGEWEFTPKRKIMVNPEHIEEIRDHTIYFPGRKVIVMEDFEHIKAKLSGG